jgi:hypothetical protein
MFELHLHAVQTEAPGTEEPLATRDRLRERFPRGAMRRMTQLGILVGAVLEKIAPASEDTLVYASVYAETRALEDYLTSFPTPSPTLFQTSIHPSAVQQVLIARQQPVREFFPHTGSNFLVAHALQTALSAVTPRVIFCGGEERGSWLRELGVASETSFAFALELSRERTGSIGTLALIPTDETEGGLTLAKFFDALHARQALDQRAAPGWRLSLRWT